MLVNTIDKMRSDVAGCSLVLKPATFTDVDNHQVMENTPCMYTKYLKLRGWGGGGLMTPSTPWMRSQSIAGHTQTSGNFVNTN